LQGYCSYIDFWIVYHKLDYVFNDYRSTYPISLRMVNIGYIFFWKPKEIKNRTATQKWIT